MELYEAGLLMLKQGFQAHQNLALDLIVKFGLTGTTGTWKAHNGKRGLKNQSTTH